MVFFFSIITSFILISIKIKDFENQIAEFIIIKSIAKPPKKRTVPKIQNKPKNTLEKDAARPSIKRTRSKIQSKPKHSLEKCVAKLSKKRIYIFKESNQTKKVFQCDICNKNLATKSSLGQHRRDKHSGLWYFCDDCSTGKASKEGRFRYVYKLQTHVRNKHQRELEDTEKIPQNSLIEETKRK